MKVKENNIPYGNPIKDALCQQLLNHMSEGFALHEIICDEKGTPIDYRFLEVNPAFEKVTGLKKEDILGKTALSVLPNLEPFWIETYGKVALTGKPIVFEGYTESLNGYYRVISFSPEKGKFVTIFTELAENGESDGKLLNAEEKLRAISESAADGIIVIDKQGIVRYINQAGAELFGREKKEILGKKFGYSVQRGRSSQIEIIHPDGKTITAEMKIVDIEWEKKPAFLASLRDVTERVQREGELRENQKLFAEAQAIAHLGSWNWQIKENILRWSDETYRIFACDPAEFDGTYEAFLERVLPEDRELVDTAVQRAFRSDGNYDIEHRIVLPSGEVRIVREKAKVEFDQEGKPVRMLGVVQDITEQKQTEEQMKKQLHWMKVLNQLSQSIIMKQSRKSIYKIIFH